MSGQNHVSIKSLAEQMGMDRSHMRRYILKLGFKPQKRRTHDSRNQLALTVKADEASAILAMRERQGFDFSEKQIEDGVFYIIQLVPELDPQRIKLGFANDIKDRLMQHRTVAPTAKVIRCWPCRRSWEKTIIDCLAAGNCKHVLNEVFECFEIDAMLVKGDEIFRMFPNPSTVIELSEHSPLCDDEADCQTDGSAGAKEVL